MRTQPLLRTVAAAAAFAASIWVAPQAPAEDAPLARTPVLRAELLAETTSVKPGVPVQLAVRLVLQSGWHLYWRNPGDAGMPPSFDWQLPAGFRAAAVGWPTPRRFESKDVVSYGYAGEVTFPVEVAVPATARAGERVRLAADVLWLACKDICTDGKSAVSLELPVLDRDPERDDGNKERFEAVRRSLPRSVPAERVTVVRDRTVVTIDLRRADVPLPTVARVEFLPADGKVVTYGPGRRGEGSQVVLEARSDEPVADERLRGIVVVADGETRTGYEIDAPIEPPSIVEAR